MTEYLDRSDGDCAEESSTENEELLGLLMDNYLSSLEVGTPLDLEQLVSQHPQLEFKIRSMVESLEMLHGATQEIRTGKPRQSPIELDITKRLGDFEIGQEIGRGGMGVVYEARQLSLGRQVALKVLPFAAVWDQKQIARFRNEAQAAAQLQHANIVPVFAVGQERGVHFYAMQFITGQSLDKVLRELRSQDEQDQLDQSQVDQQKPVSKTDWATASTEVAAGKQHASETRSDLSEQYVSGGDQYCRTIAQLGVQAAEALHYAHECGVVHRDIKPSNLMLDHQQNLWVTDFGLARVQNSPGVTLTGDIVGTLRYMSPEQAAGKNALVDHRTDVYALGATLYELLTRQSAFPGDDRGQVLKAIEQQEPQSLRSINSKVPQDLETVVLRAMAKSRDERYSTAQALADDLNRFLEGKPTVARRPTMVDRGAKWLRRHRRVATAAAMVLVLLTTGSTIGAILLAREKAEKEAALIQSQRHLEQSQQHFLQARQVVDRFGIQLADQLQDTPGTEVLRQQLLLETLNYYHGFLDQIGTDTDLRDQLAMTHLKAGVVTAKLGADKKAIGEYRAAQRILQQLIADDPTDPKLQSHLALSRNNLALLLSRQGDSEDALAEYEQAIATQKHLVATHPEDESYAGLLAESHVNRGTLLGQLGQAEAAVQSLTHAITILHEASAAAPKNPQQARNLAIAYNNLSFVQRQSDVDLAERSAQRAVEILEHFTEVPNASDECQADLALCYSNLAAIQSENGRTDQAIHSYQDAISLHESLVRKSPHIVRHRSELAASLNNLALLEIRQGDIAEAAKAFRHANWLFVALLKDYPNQVSYASGWAALLNNQALALAKIERYEEAIHAYRQAIEIQQHVIEMLGYSPAVRLTLSRMVYNYSQALQAVGRFDEAVEQASFRRNLWQGNGERLFGVAVELAQILQSKKQQNDSVEDLSGESLRSAVVETLQESLEAGHDPQIDLAIDPRFEGLLDHPEFDKLIDALKRHDQTVEKPAESHVGL